MKRLFDIFVALCALMVFSPFLLMACLLIKKEDGGTVFFTQERLGLHRRPFLIWKLRTMQNGQVTKVGRWLRATAIDEFTQFIHVLKGEMSIVGPRPMTEADIARLGWDTTARHHRWQVKPGVTGLVQVYGGFNAEESRILEESYVAYQSFWLDLKIIFWSFWINVLGKKRVRGWLSKIRLVGGLTKSQLFSKAHSSPKQAAESQADVHPQ